MNYATWWHNSFMRRCFKTRYFQRWMRKTDLTDEALCAAAQEMSQGLVDANLGGGVYKKRVALAGRGKSGSARTLLATNLGSRWFFVFGFEKNERANISADELEDLKDLAHDLLRLNAQQLTEALAANELTEICHEH
jgi:hypothetical protein